jgi:hypothetical protein
MRAAAFAVAAAGWCAAAVAAPDAGDRRAQETYPLVLLVQGDGTIASAPALPGDPSQGASLRLRRVRAGADLGAGSFRLRAVLEAQQADGFGEYYAPVEGGRLVGPLRAADSFVSWAPHVAFHADAGVLRVPFSFTRQVGEADLRLPERAAFARTLTPDFRAGAGIGGELGALAYAAAVMSASRFLDGDLFERGALVAARLAAEPIGPVGATPWRRAPDDPWADWIRFRHGVSFMYGTLFEAKTIAAGTDLSVQRRGLVATGEYVFVHAPSGNQQGAAIEPGLALFPRRVDLAARGDWRRAAGENGWGAGAALTFYARDPRARLQAGVEHRIGPRPLPDASSALVRLTLTID